MHIAAVYKSPYKIIHIFGALGHNKLRSKIKKKNNKIELDIFKMEILKMYVCIDEDKNKQPYY